MRGVTEIGCEMLRERTLQVWVHALRRGETGPRNGERERERDSADLHYDTLAFIHFPNNYANHNMQ